MKAKKFIETKTEGEYEINKFHVSNVKVEIRDLEEIVEYLDLSFDYEEASLIFGVNFTWDGELYSVEAGKFVDAIHNRLDDHCDEIPEYFVPVLDKLKDYKEYTLYC